MIERIFTRRAGALCALFLFSAVVHAQTQPSLTFLTQLNDYASAGYNDCWGYTAPDGREYALLGVVTGTSIIDITDPQSAAEVAFVPNHLQTASSWKDIKTYRTYAYVVTESSNSGLQIIDLSGLPGSATLVKTDTSLFRRSHNLWIDTARALLYSEGNSAGPVRIWSLADPANPVSITTFGPSNKEIHDIYARGNLAYLSEGNGGDFSVFDVSNASAPVLLKRFTSSSGGYAHNAWLSDDGNFLMTTEEVPEGLTVKYWDVSDLDSVRVRGEYLGSTNRAHNAHIKGRYAYISHYAGGLKIVDLIDPDNLVEVASYATYQGAPTSSFLGAWGAFPFFDSGKILVSDMQLGLFVLHFSPAVVTTVRERNSGIPGAFSLLQNYPNPFNPETHIRFRLDYPAHVRIVVTDLLGRIVDVLVDAELQTGSHQVTWNPSEKTSGVYVYSMRVGNEQQSRRMILQR